jgi:hypothetical protein
MESLKDSIKVLTNFVHSIDDEIVFFGNHNNDQPGLFFFCFLNLCRKFFGGRREGWFMGDEERRRGRGDEGREGDVVFLRKTGKRELFQ